MAANEDAAAILKEVLTTVKSLQLSQEQLASHVDAINGRVNILAGIKEVESIVPNGKNTLSPPGGLDGVTTTETHDHATISEDTLLTTPEVIPSPGPSSEAATSRIILT
jgi:hypothetical protein